MRTLNIPIARDRYDRQEEQVFRERIRRAVEDSVSRESLYHPTTGLPLFFGQPHAQALGTNNAFSVTQNVLTHIPFPNIVMTHPNLVASGEFKTAYAMDVEISGSLYHAAPGGAARTAAYTMYFSLYNGSTYGTDFIAGAVTQEFSIAWTLHTSVMFASQGLNFIRMRLIHNDTAANLFDLTKSWMNIKQLGIDPKTVGTRMTP